MLTRWRSAATSRPVLVLGILLVVGFGVRLIGISRPPLDFHSIRQFHSALIERAIFLDHSAPVPPWERKVADIAAAEETIYEPRVNETIVAAALLAVGGDDLWVGRLVSTIYWLVGGVILYALVCRFARLGAALVSVAFFLLIPFALTISRSLQPESLMVATELGAILAIYRYHENPGRARLAVAAVAAALAIFIKIPAGFLVLPAFVGLELSSRGLKGAVRDRATYLFLLASLLPGAAWTLLTPNPGTVFLDGLWLSGFYVVGWLTQMNVVVGLGAAGAAAIATALYARGLSRPLLASLWVGYGLSGLFFDYAIATHSYYSVNLIVIVAIGVGLIVEGTSARARRFLVPIVAANVIALFIVASEFGHEPFQLGAGDLGLVARYQRIGDVLHHTTSAIVLADGFGSSPVVDYYGLMATQDWPSRGDLDVAPLERSPTPTAEVRLSRMQALAPSHWFIVANLDELTAQPDLLHLLKGRYPVAAAGDGFAVFDLFQRVQPP